MRGIEPHCCGAYCGRLFGKEAQRGKIANTLIAHSINKFAPQPIKLRGDPKSAGISTQCFRQKRRVGNDSEMGKALRRLLRPNPMPPEWQSWQRNVADRYPAPIGGDCLAALSVTGGDLEAAR